MTLKKYNSSQLIDVCGKSILDYLAECLSRFNHGEKEVLLRILGGNISKGLDISFILGREFNEINVDSISTDSIRLDDEVSLTIEFIKLKINSISCSEKKTSQPFKKFTPFPIYHLFLDTLLSEKKKLTIKKYNGKNERGVDKPGSPLINICSKNGKIRYEIVNSIKKAPKNDLNIVDDLRQALYRCGLLISPSWKKVAKTLSEFDDVIIGLDTNILFDGALTEQILNSLFLVEEKTYRHTPNWLLFIIPSAVMHELEQTANKRDNVYLTRTGIIGFRAIQEILKLDMSRDLRGVSMSIAGASNPVMENRSEIHKLREDLIRIVDKLNIKKHENENSLNKTNDNPLRRHLQWASGDMVIRDQFKEFIRNIDFHKGIYFITSDKSNAALARTEGLNAIYYKKPEKNKLKDEINPKFSLYDQEIYNTVPLGNVIYEMAIEFKEIEITWNDSGKKEKIILRCDAIGESLDPWIKKELMIGKKDFYKLESNYQKKGIINLQDIEKKWNQILECIM